MSASTRKLASFLSKLRYGDLPPAVIERTKELFGDWLGCATLGGGSQSVEALADFAMRMGPADGPCEIFALRRHSSPYFAALLNGASSHLAEQDDIHRLAGIHPAVVVFPAALAVAQERRSSGRDFIVAAVAGYEAGARIGAYLGRSHYQRFHATGTVGTMAAASAAAKLLGSNVSLMLHALG